SIGIDAAEKGRGDASPLRRDCAIRATRSVGATHASPSISVNAAERGRGSASPLRREKERTFRRGGFQTRPLHSVGATHASPLYPHRRCRKRARQCLAPTKRKKEPSVGAGFKPAPYTPWGRRRRPPSIRIDAAEKGRGDASPLRRERYRLRDPGNRARRRHICA